jgi:hypothetical protein
VVRIGALLLALCAWMPPELATPGQLARAIGFLEAR